MKCKQFLSGSSARMDDTAGSSRNQSSSIPTYTPYAHCSVMTGQIPLLLYNLGILMRNQGVGNYGESKQSTRHDGKWNEWLTCQASMYIFSPGLSTRVRYFAQVRFLDQADEEHLIPNPSVLRMVSRDPEHFISTACQLMAMHKECIMVIKAD